jgi:RNA polymerase sigma factor (TIGR02999 family)
MYNHSSLPQQMNTASSTEVSRLLLAWGNGDQEALGKLMPVVYQELRRLAGRYMRNERPGHTLQTTGLVNEVYLKLVDQKNMQWQNRAQFFGVAAQLMRRILVDHARKHARLKRGGGAQKLSLDETAIVSNDRAAQFIALDDALTSLAELDPTKSRIVEMKFFGGLNFEEVAEVEKVSPRTIRREWRKAKAWLHQEMQK